MNRIVKVELFLLDSGRWQVDVTKEFAPENGGGSHVFQTNTPGGVHSALDVARGMVTLHRSTNPSLDAA